MNYSFKKRCLAIVVFGFLGYAGFAYATGTATTTPVDSRILDLRKQIDDLTKQADQYKGTINQKRKEGDTLKRQVDLINTQILQLQTKIAIGAKEIESTGIQINDLQGKITEAKQKVDTQKKNVSHLITLIQQDEIIPLVEMFIKSDRLSDFADQVQQNKDLTDRLVAILADLKDEQSAMESDQASLVDHKTDLQNLNQQQTNQKSSLDETKASKGELLTKTRGQEQAYQAMLSDVEEKQKEFFSQLKNAEAQAVQAGAFIVHVTADQVPPRGTKLFNYPTDDFVLTQGYGYTAYAKRGAYGGLPHNGVDLASTRGSAIHAIGHGFILASGYNGGFGNWVAVRHDSNLVSIYGHMQAPSGLANNTEVDTTSVIGYEGMTGNTTGPHVHLSLYKDFFTYLKNGDLYFNYYDGSLNPLDYIK